MTNQAYRKEVARHADRFLKALQNYQKASPEEKVRLKAVMDETLQLIHATVKELLQAGIHKQAVKVEDDYKAYMKHQTSDNLAILQEDLTGLLEYIR